MVGRQLMGGGQHQGRIASWEVYLAKAGIYNIKGIIFKNLSVPFRYFFSCFYLGLNVFQRLF